MAERRPRSKPESDIYTVLAGIALIALICGIGYVWYRQYEFTGTFNPIDLGGEDTAAITEVVDTHHV
jgi:hypothetical protein